MGKELTLEQAKALRPRDTLYSTVSGNRQGEPRKAKVNGAVKVWKRDPSQVQVPWKHGLYEYGYVTEHSLDEWSLDYDYAKEKVRKHG